MIICFVCFQKFYYNGQKDHLELCLEPLGHFPISDGMDDPQRLSEIAAGLSSSSQRSEEAIGQRSLSAGGSGVVKHGQHKKEKYVAFGGQAHKLSKDSSEKDRDVRPKVRRADQTLRHSTGENEEVEDVSMQSELEPTSKTSDSRVTFDIADTRQSHFDRGDQDLDVRDNAMETDAVTVSRLDAQSGPSSPMEVEQSKEFPLVSVDIGLSSSSTEATTPKEHTPTNHITESLVASSSHRETAVEEDHSTSMATAITTTTPTTTESKYISKKLGPGYTVLMKQPASDEEKTDGDDGEDT